MLFSTHYIPSFEKTKISAKDKGDIKKAFPLKREGFEIIKRGKCGKSRTKKDERTESGGQ